MGILQSTEHMAGNILDGIPVSHREHTRSHTMDNSESFQDRAAVTSLTIKYTVILHPEHLNDRAPFLTQRSRASTDVRTQAGDSTSSSCSMEPSSVARPGSRPCVSWIQDFTRPSSRSTSSRSCSSCCTWPLVLRTCCRRLETGQAVINV